MRVNVLCCVLGVTMALALAGPADAIDQALSEAERAAVEEAVRAANTQVNEAAVSLDVERLFGWIVAEGEGAIIQDGRLFATRDEALVAVRQGYEGVQSLKRTFEQTHVSVLSKTAALLTGSGTSSVVLNDGRSFGGRFAVSLVFVLRDGSWKILQGHFSVPNQ